MKGTQQAIDREVRSLTRGISNLKDKPYLRARIQSHLVNVPSFDRRAVVAYLNRRFGHVSQDREFVQLREHAPADYSEPCEEVSTHESSRGLASLRGLYGDGLFPVEYEDMERSQRTGILRGNVGGPGQLRPLSN
jgi:hypothetical protein